jgi:hypothetical protein
MLCNISEKGEKNMNKGDTVDEVSMVQKTKMENRLDDLFLILQTKGFIPIEIPGLMKDVFDVFNNPVYSTITDINRELEDLGWGIEIMDDATYELINSLVQ